MQPNQTIRGTEHKNVRTMTFNFQSEDEHFSYFLREQNSLNHRRAKRIYDFNTTTKPSQSTAHFRYRRTPIENICCHSAQRVKSVRIRCERPCIRRRITQIGGNRNRSRARENRRQNNRSGKKFTAEKKNQITAVERIWKKNARKCKVCPGSGERLFPSTPEQVQSATMKRLFPPLLPSSQEKPHGIDAFLL